MIRITSETFDPSTELSTFEKRTGDAGAFVTFIGKVRGTSGDATVNSLYLEHYPGVTENSVRAIEAQARTRWELSDVLIIHRVGNLKAGEPIVMVCTAAAHRRDAFEAADFLMDYLKTESLFWKKELRSDGASWIEPRKADYTDAARWRSGELSGGSIDRRKDRLKHRQGED